MEVRVSFLILASVILTVSCQHSNSVANETHGEWSFNYKDIAAWTAHYSTCGGKHQSPIGIVTNAKEGNLLVLQNVYPKLVIAGYEKKLSKMSLANNGHTVVATVSEGMSVSGGPLGDSQYKFVQLHFHWGSTDNVGSEHRLDNKTYPIECHFVHYNTKYKSLDVALDHPDGLLVFGVWGELSNSNNTALQPITNHLGEIVLSPRQTEVISETIEPMEDLFPVNRNNYFHYNGSLTTPTCHESVVWIIFHDPIQISEYQLNEFRTLKQGDHDHLDLENNFRPLQPINGRTVEQVINGASVLERCSLVAIIVNAIALFVLKTL